MSVGKKIAYNTVIQFVGKFAAVGISLVLVTILTRKLGVERYGDYITVLAYGQILAIFADLGVNIFLIKQLSTPHEGERRLVGDAFGLRIMSALIVLALGALVLPFMPYTPLVKAVALIALFSIFSQTINSLFVSVLQSRLQMGYAVLADVIGRLLTLALTVFFIYQGKGLIWVVGSVVVGSTLNMIISWLYARRFIIFSISGSWKTWGSILKQSLPISVTSILSYLYFRIDVLLLSTLPLIGMSNALETGIYGTAYKVLDISLLIPSIFLGSVFPVLNNFLQTKDSRVNELLRRAFEVMAFFGIAITVISVVLAPQIIHFIAGPEFANAVVPLRILSLAVLTSYFAGVFTYTVMSLGKMRQLITVYGIAAVFNLIANFILIPRYSYVAASWNTFVTELIVLIPCFIICRQSLRFSLQVPQIVKMLFAGALMAAAGWFLADQGLVVAILGSIGTYLLVSLLVGAVNKDELVGLIRRQPASMTGMQEADI